MEVHHHSHHPKKWKEYVTEFIMLFAAVTLGFFAENQREHLIEGNREKQYMQSLYEDLRKDTTILNSLIKYDTIQTGKLDTSTILLNNNVWDANTIKVLYRLNLKTAGGLRWNLSERTSAQLKKPTSITTDSFGNLYIADTENYRVRKVDKNGIISTFAGSGTNTGDSILATSAQLGIVRGVYADSTSNNVYIICNYKVRMVDPSGKIYTIAGTGEPGYAGDNGPAILAMFNAPQGIVKDKKGNLQIKRGNPGNRDRGKFVWRCILEQGGQDAYTGLPLDLSSIDLEPKAIRAQSQIQHLPQLSELKLGRKPPIAPLPRL